MNKYKLGILILILILSISCSSNKKCAAYSELSNSSEYNLND